MRRTKGLVAVAIPALLLAAGIDGKADSAGVEEPKPGKERLSVLDVRTKGIVPPAAGEGRRRILGSPRAQARPGAFTELVVQLELVGVPQEAPFELDLVYRDTLLEAPRIVPPERPSTRVDVTSAGHVLLRRDASSQEEQPDVLERVSRADQAPLFCEDADAGDRIVRLGFPIPTPEEYPEGEIPLELRLSVPQQLVTKAKACIETAVFTTRGLVLHRGENR